MTTQKNAKSVIFRFIQINLMVDFISYEYSKVIFYVLFNFFELKPK